MKVGRSASFPVVRSKNMLQNVHKQGPPKMSAYQNGKIMTRKRKNWQNWNLTLEQEDPLRSLNYPKCENFSKRDDFFVIFARDNGRQKLVYKSVPLLLLLR